MIQSKFSATHLFLVTALILSVGTFLFSEVYEYDIWWHVAIGRDILSKWSVPVVDSFAAASLGRLYHDSHWLFQVVVAMADRLAAMVGVQLTMVLIWTATLVFVGRAVSRWIEVEYALLLVFWAAMVSLERFIPRPELITFLGVSFFYWRLQAQRYRTWGDISLLFFVQVVWVNSHGLFVIGPFMAGCYWLGGVCSPALSRQRHLPELTRLLILLLLATFVTPYGWGNWQYAFLLFREAGPNAPEILKNVGELSSTFGAATRSGVAFWFYLALLVSFALVFVFACLRRERLDLARFLIVLGMLAASLTGRRNIVLFALVAIPFTAEMLAALIPSRRSAPRWLVVAWACGMLAWAWFPLSGGYYSKVDIPGRFGLGATPSYFPHEFPEYLDGIGFREQVFNSNQIGGFYLYHSYPQRVPFSDGRWEVYDSSIFKEIGQALKSSAHWQEFSTRHNIKGIMLQHVTNEAALALPWLRKDANWKLVYLDRAISFWLPSDTRLPVSVVDIGPSGALPAAQRIDDCLILDAFYRLVSADHLRVLNLQRALVYGKRTEEILTDLGQVLMKTESYDAALQVFERLRREYPRNVIALNELAFLAVRRGEIETARQMLQLALKISPHDKDVQANYNRLGGGSKRE